MCSRAGVAKRTTAPVLKTGAPCEPMGSNPIPGAINEPTGFVEYLTKARRLALPRSYTRSRIIWSLDNRINLWDLKAFENYFEDSKVTNVRKEVVSQTYSDWCRWKGGARDKPKKQPRAFSKITYYT